MPISNKGSEQEEQKGALVLRGHSRDTEMGHTRRAHRYATWPKPRANCAAQPWPAAARAARCTARRLFSLALPLPGALPRPVLGRAARGLLGGYQPAARRRDAGKNCNGAGSVTAGAAGGIVSAATSL
jgi:hypothetical protein